MNLFSSRHFMRILRALVAIWAVFEFVNTQEWTVLFIGGFFAIQAIFDLGCGPAGCASAPQSRQQPETSIQDVEYEEIK